MKKKNTLLKKNPDHLKDYNEVEYDSKISPKSIYEFLHIKITHPRFFLILRMQLKMLKSNACIKLIEGAVCSSPDSGSKWLINYENHKSFKFKGYIIMHIKTGSVKWALSKYHYLLRDGIVITNLNEYAIRLNKLQGSN